MVINNSPLSNVDRLHYLYSSVTGEASRALSHLSATENNFDIAWDIITSRYENKQRLISIHLQTLFTLKSVATETSQDLRALRDAINISLRMLKNLNRPVDTWSDIIVFLGAQKLDRVTRKAWEDHLSEMTDFPTYEEFDAFLGKRIRALDAIPLVKREKTSDAEKSKQCKPRTVPTHTTTSQRIACPVCHQSHLIYLCPKFLAQSVSERFQFIRKQKRCVNCFSIKHPTAQCQSKHVCKECNQKHNTLLRFPNSKDVAPSTSMTSSESHEIENEISSHIASKAPMNSCVLLSTARVKIHSNDGRCVKARALLDQGSVATLITEHLAQSLRLQRKTQPTKIIGVGDSQSYARHVAEITITPVESDEPAYSTTAIIMRSLTRYVPSKTRTATKWSQFSDLKLADEPMSSDPVDIIIGADLYGQLLLPGLRKGSARTPTAQQTTLGWILSGPYAQNSSSSYVGVHHLSLLENLDQNLRRFWEMEDIKSPAIVSPENQICEEHFRSTHSRTKDGRYIVRLPFKTKSPIDLRDSRSGALQCLYALERRFHHNSDAANSYREFMAEYEALGHMKRVDPLSCSLNQGYFIPHHAVVRETSETTRLRVVFNASRQTSKGKSLNDYLFIGPKLQQDLVAILIRWRQFQFAYTADVEKMYRQILVHSEDTNFQKILWRDSPRKSVSEYKLLTVTYGTASAPYLAQRVLLQLVEDEGSQFPAAVQVIRNQAYVDDFIFGGDSLESVRQLRTQTVDLLAKGGFVLRKWASNHPDLLSDINPDNHGLAKSKLLQVNETISVLGLIWNPALDQFQFRLCLSKEFPRTKRTILSTIAKLFDPLGWIAPITITAKIDIRTLWETRCDWDDVLPQTLLQEWENFYVQLPQVESIVIPRRISPHTIKSQCLHGFADASTKAYAAAVYSRNILHDGTVCVSLIISKTRVAPVKTVSIPRLELCAALLLARLLDFVQHTLNSPNIETHCWTDSTVTLAWVTQPPTRWKTFVANRVAKIQELIPNVQWHYVSTTENPADAASRGVNIKQIKTHQLWWSGPSWLIDSSDSWPQLASLNHLDSSLEEASHAIPSCTTCVKTWELANRYSSWPKLLRVTAYVMQFIQQLHTRIHARTNANLTANNDFVLKPEIINRAKQFWLKEIQLTVFPDEVRALTKAQPISKKSTLLSLAPYLDSDGLIRVRGRLSNSELTKTAKNPIILRSHPLVNLIIEYTHRKMLHAGPNLTLACLRSEYWIIRARATVRNVLYRCIACTREKAKIPTEFMGDLPAPRVKKAERPFMHTGVDYAGPIQIRTNSGRGSKSHKAYIAVFICLTVKAVHLELVSDYSSAAFLAAYQRMVSRRGLPKAMYSDNGTTFQGANRELRTAFHAAIRNTDFGNQITIDETEWHFLPPNAPHFGGLWEAAVKSAKHHLKRSIGNRTLTFEEMITFLCRIEACLNSRPLGPVSECIDDYRVLTPGHFLIGTPLVTPPEPSVLEVRDNRLSRWQLLQKMTETFWNAWKNDYLQTLQQRPKWKTRQNLAKVGKIVLVRNPNLPPCRWELGRIITCHPGQDGLVRVVTIRTASAEYKRPITRLCFLPIDITAEIENTREDEVVNTDEHA